MNDKSTERGSRPLVLDAMEFPWNVEVDVGGVALVGPGMDSEAEAEAIAGMIRGRDGVESVEVVHQ